jgi:hypothetical protein
MSKDADKLLELPSTALNCFGKLPLAGSAKRERERKNEREKEKQ